MVQLEEFMCMVSYTCSPPYNWGLILIEDQFGGTNSSSLGLFFSQNVNVKRASKGPTQRSKGESLFPCGPPSEHAARDACETIRESPNSFIDYGSPTPPQDKPSCFEGTTLCGKGKPRATPPWGCPFKRTHPEAFLASPCFPDSSHGSFRKALHAAGGSQRPRPQGHSMGHVRPWTLPPSG